MNHEYTYIEGNRLPVPAAVKSSHFMYKAKGPVLDAQDVWALTQAVLTVVEMGGLYPGQIELFSPNVLGRKHSAAAKETLLRLADQLRLPGLEWASAPTILVCEWAAFHEDSSFSGNAFVSAVLSTGSYPYIMQTAHTRVRTDGLTEQAVVASTRTLRRGDTLVFDPTTPHYAVPAHPHEDSLLILLQLEVHDNTEQERERILAALPPVEDDLDDKAIFEGIGV